jgi:hypothetical protein
MPSLLQYIYLAIGTFHDLNFNNRLFCWHKQLDQSEH